MSKVNKQKTPSQPPPRVIAISKNPWEFSATLQSNLDPLATVKQPEIEHLAQGILRWIMYWFNQLMPFWSIQSSNDYVNHPWHVLNIIKLLATNKLTVIPRDYCICLQTWESQRQPIKELWDFSWSEACLIGKNTRTFQKSIAID